MTDDYKISFTEVACTFGERNQAVRAIDSVSFDVKQGEFVCIIGPSGCGKSTLLRIVAGLVNPSSGVVSINTKSENFASMVFQDYSIFPWKTVRENVRFGLDIRHVDKEISNKRVDELLALLHLEDRESSYPSELSGGMKQRVAIARALATDPEVLLMDEPFAAVDAHLREEMQEELLRIWQEDLGTVLFVTHSLSEAVLLADRVIVLSESPSRVIADVAIPFARPRTSSIRNQAEFAQLENSLRTMLKRKSPDE